MSETKFQLFNTLTESRSFLDEKRLNNISVSDASNFLYLSLVLLYVYSMERQTYSFQHQYIRRTRTYNNYGFFRPSQTDLYILVYLLLGNSKSYKHNDKVLRGLHLNYKELNNFLDRLSAGSLTHTTASSYFYSLERQIHTSDGAIKNMRREALRWDIIDASEKKALATKASTYIKRYSYAAEVLDPIRKLQDSI